MNDMKSIRFPPPVADEMIRAILEGRKTVTRRVALPANDLKPFPQKDYPDGWMFRKRAYRSWDSVIREPNGVMSLCKYSPSDILYVREAWAWRKCYDCYACETPNFYKGHMGCFAYKASTTNIHAIWRPSIHMPHEAARLFLRVTDVRVERLQDITKEQALSEGVPDDSDYPLDNPVYCPKCKGEGIIGAIHPESLGYMETDCPYCDTPQKRFSHLWDSTIKKPADRALYGWAANPWVWVIEFERCEKPETEPPDGDASDG